MNMLEIDSTIKEICYKFDTNTKRMNAILELSKRCLSVKDAITIAYGCEVYVATRLKE